MKPKYLGYALSLGLAGAAALNAAGSYLKNETPAITMDKAKACLDNAMANKLAKQDGRASTSEDSNFDGTSGSLSCSFDETSCIINADLGRARGYDTISVTREGGGSASYVLSHKDMELTISTDGRWIYGPPVDAMSGQPSTDVQPGQYPAPLYRSYHGVARQLLADGYCHKGFHKAGIKGSLTLG
jgi:hypothetical protein